MATPEITSDTTSPSTAPEDVHSRVGVSEPAAGLLRDLTKRHGPLMFHQSGGCCDGSSPMCFPDGEYLLGDGDVHLGDLDVGLDRAVPVYMSRSQFAYWRHTHITIDVVKGRGAGFSVEAPEGVRFLIRSRLLSEAESAAFDD
ncbi:hypothetical protein SAMN05443575_0526 [Jatrophihabitans endophyticus]|uniref:UDP-glucose 4-epimerase n=1 Tax=Jatrophihabitans endophyticus TaxID=1206085 RepID=A0A1M5DC75_9ACTN|nr:DUF779 domain-containing protein [Jatrophihabitans endophyticus]SHF64454.1 hypothetical protein SAMN05443575_0526 [Jatrophihabitans endophyticus]